MHLIRLYIMVDVVHNDIQYLITIDAASFEVPTKYLAGSIASCVVGDGCEHM